MKKFKVLISEPRQYLVEAGTIQEAKEKMMNGEWLEELDMICNDPEILEVELYEEEDE